MRSSFLINLTERQFLSSHHLDDVKLKAVNNMMLKEVLVPKNYFENINTFKVHRFQNKIQLSVYCFLPYKEIKAFDSIKVSLINTASSE